MSQFDDTSSRITSLYEQTEYDGLQYRLKRQKVIELRCPYCGKKDIATGPDWVTTSMETGESEGLGENICRSCHRSFWV